MAKTTGSAKPAPVKRSATPAKATGARSASAKQAAGRSTTHAASNGAKKAAPAKQASAKKATAAKSAPAKATAARSVSARSAASKAPAGKATATVTKKAPAKKAPAKKASATKAATTPRNGSAPKAAAPAKSPFPAKWLAAQEAALRDERATYVRQAESLQAEADALVADFESGDAQFDEDGGEGDTLSSERERDLTLSAQARAAVEEIDHALTKFPKGTYGICEASGDPIPAERLEAIPWARVQVQYKTGGLGRR